ASPAAISVSSETLEDVAAALAAQIDDTAAGFTATARGTTLVIARATGSFAVGRAVTPLDGSAAAAAPASSVLTLTGTPGEGQPWTLTLNGLSVTHTVSQGQSLSGVAGALAALVNGSPALSGYIAAAEGQQLVIIRTAGGSLTSSVSAAPAARTAVDGAT